MDRIDEAVEAGLAAYYEGGADDLGGLIENVILAGMKVLLGEPVACNVIDPYGTLVAERVTTEHADEIIGRHEWSNCHKGDFLYAPSLGEGHE